MQELTVSLVLGSGGARGLAHVGVIRWLEENGFSIRSVSGCSIGALVGGIYAAGKLDDYEQWSRAVTRLDILSLLDIAWTSNGLFRGDRVINALVELVGNRLIEELPVAYTAVATDWKRRREVWIQSGPLFDAIRASVSVPILFTPFSLNGTELIDGGVLNPVPITPTLKDQTDLTIAVDVGGPSEEPPHVDVAVPHESTPSSRVRLELQRHIDQLKERFGDGGRNNWAAFDIVNESFEAMQSTISRMKTAASPPDYMITIPRNVCRMLDFHRADEVIAIGYDRAATTMCEEVQSWNRTR